METPGALTAGEGREQKEAKTVAFRPALALCLSGGGYRAALLHLGAVRRLNELGVLAKVDAISCVSGGSVLGGFLASRVDDWRPASGIILDGQWETKIAQPFRALATENIRTRPLIKRYLPWNWGRPETAVQALAANYRRLIGDRLLATLPRRPRFIFSATDLVFGVNWIFTPELVGDYVAGYAPPPPGLTLADVVAASSCFPPVFDPYPIKAMGIDPALLTGGDRRPEQTRLRETVELNDGGNYDNFGLEPVWHDLKRRDEGHPTLLISDGGATFDYQTPGRFFWQRWQRYAGVQGEQVARVRKRWLFERARFKHLATGFWSIGLAPEQYGDGEFKPAWGYSTSLAERVIAEIRTDFDAFSVAEAATLENHGYALADAAVCRYLPELAANPVAPFVLPHPEWTDEGAIERALKGSNKRTLFGRRRA